MRRATRRSAATMSLVIALTGGFTATGVAQDEGCTLVTAAEVEAAFGITGVADGGTGSFCNFSAEDLSLFILIQPTATDLEELREQYPDATETTIAGHPALTSEAGSSVIVGLPSSVLSASYYGSLPWADAQPIITGLLEIAVPRAPAGPDPEDVARLEALIPPTIAGGPATISTFPGDLLLSFMDQADPTLAALRAALAAQGLTEADILMVGGETEADDDDYSVIAILVDGGDAAPILEPFFRVFAGANGGEAVFTPVEIAGRAGQEIEGVTDERLVVVPSGDVMLAASVPESELEAVFSRLP